MANAHARQVTTYHLAMELTPNELDTLRGMMQNPLWNVEQPDLEPEDVKRIRMAIFNACAQHRT